MDKNKEDIRHAKKEAKKTFIFSILVLVVSVFFEKPHWAVLFFSIVILYSFLVSLVFILSCYVPRPNYGKPNPFLFFLWFLMGTIIYPYNTARVFLQQYTKKLRS